MCGRSFMTGMNLATITSVGKYHDLNAENDEALKGWIRQYCQDHPLAPFSSAVIETLNRLPFLRIKTGTQ